MGSRAENVQKDPGIFYTEKEWSHQRLLGPCQKDPEANISELPLPKYCFLWVSWRVIPARIEAYHISLNAWVHNNAKNDHRWSLEGAKEPAYYFGNWKINKGKVSITHSAFCMRFLHEDKCSIKEVSAKTWETVRTVSKSDWRNCGALTTGGKPTGKWERAGKENSSQTVRTV